MAKRRVFAILFGALLAAACGDPAPTTGKLVLDVKGLPAGATANVRVTGPNNFFEVVTEPKTLENLEPGDYIVRVDTILHSNTRYGVAVTRDTFPVGKGQTITADIPYNVSSGSIEFTINGLPAGIPANIMIEGPGYTGNVVNAGTIGGLPPGKYYVRTDTMISIQGDRFGAGKVLDSLTLPASATPVAHTVSYTLVSATLALTINGLPSALTVPQSPVTITGPNNFSQKFFLTTTLRGLVPGTYTVTAASVNNCPSVYRTSVGAQNPALAMGQTANVTVNYTEGTANTADLNLRIERAALIQVTQDAIGSVPMVANRSALLRVYGVANQCNTTTPKVRVTLGTGQQYVLSAPESQVRYTTDEGTLQSTWNVTIPANLVQSGLSFIAEIDHDGTVAETSESDNRYPASGTVAVTVKTVPTIGVRIVPLVQSGLTGNVTTENVDQYLTLARKIHPIAQYDVDIRTSPLTISQSLTATGGSAWQGALSELNSARSADASPRYYYGIAKVSYTGGIAGIGYVTCNGDCKAAMGWDRDFTSAAEVMAHELGHNFGRFHAPCGGPAGPDTQYPSTGLYVGGKIGVYGFDAATESLKPPEVYTDVMGYCANQWISDYTYVGMLNYLSDPNRSATMPAIVAASVEPSLLVWGRIENGRPILEPAFEIDGVPSMPKAAGPNRITATDGNGSEIFSFAFAGSKIADLTGDFETFSFVVPRSALRGRTLAQLRLNARGQTVSNVASDVVSADPQVVASRPAAGRVRLRWNANRFPVVMVRDRVTGDVLSFARGGDMTIVTAAEELDLNFSNRLRSARRPLRVLR